MKAVFSAIIAILVSPIWAFGQGVGLAEANDPLLEAQWTYRLVVVCAEDSIPSEPTLIDQQYEEAFEDWPGYIERDMILVWISSEDIMSWHPKPSAFKDATLHIRVSEAGATDLRERTNCTPDRDFVVLIGKDGGIKARSETTLSNSELFALIDSMPMRQQEMARAAEP